MNTNSTMSNSSFLQLSTEMFHLIFDYLHPQTILHSLGVVCRELYDRLKLDFSTFSQSDWTSLSQFIRPLNVIAISLAQDHKEKFSQTNFLVYFFKLDEMHLDLSNEILRITNVFEPVKHVLRRLTISYCTYEQYHRILSSCVNLKTLLIKDYFCEKETSTVLPLFLQLNYLQLRSLTINSFSLLFKQLCSVLSLTPFLVHLKITIRHLENNCNLNGAAWEEFLRGKLIHLKNFQFYFVYNTKKIRYCDSPNHLMSRHGTSRLNHLSSRQVRKKSSIII